MTLCFNPPRGVNLDKNNYNFIEEFPKDISLLHIEFVPTVHFYGGYFKVQKQQSLNENTSQFSRRDMLFNKIKRQIHNVRFQSRDL